MFSNRSFCQFAIIALLFTTVEAQASNKPSDAELAAITQRGVLLAEYDTAAWQASDAVTAAHPAESRANLYIARKTDAGWIVDFGRLNEAGDKFLLAYEVVQTTRRVARPLIFLMAPLKRGAASLHFSRGRVRCCLD